LIIFDGVCNLCNSSVQFVIMHDRKGVFKFASLQSETGKKILSRFNLPTDYTDSFILIQYNNAYTRSTAALKVARHLDGLIKILYGFIIVPAFIRNWVYGIISRNRYKWFGKKESCMIPAPHLESRFLK
ncbi:MAG TPA: thiol-disulfide oxidoreductase DCC family protein, partial [Ferruginibacter sp.]|nr:thiol-disulfide oxidoreductase DCC family protein [Ferruginibacter sp.]